MKKVYVCTPLKAPKFNLKLITETILKYQVFAFIPPTGQLQDKTNGAILDKLMIENCDEIFVFGLIGRDCAWEIGYATGLNKKVTIFVDESNREMVESDWMTVINVELVRV